MKKLNLALAGALIALAGCKDLRGTLSLREAITLKNDRDKQVQIQAGSHSATLKIKSKKKVNLEIKLSNGKKTDFLFKTDKNLKDLKSGDRLQISARSSGQPYDIDGVYNVTKQATQPVRTVESCTFYVQEWRCRMVTIPKTCKQVRECNPVNPNQCETREVCTGGGQEQRCGYEKIAYSGSQEVEYYHLTTTDLVRMQLLASGKAVGDFNGSESSTEKIYNFKATCR